MLIFLFLLHTSTSGSECAAYTCSLPTDYITQNTCIYFQNSTTIPFYYISPCTDLINDYCPVSVNSNSTCTASPLVSVLKFPGEKCHTDADCNSFSIRCSNQICLGLSEGNPCISHEYCNPGLFCNEICTPQLQIGDIGCYSDLECVNNAGCDSSNANSSGTCIQYWSLGDSMPVRKCSDHMNWLCKSSTCSSNSCVAAVKSISIPLKCYQDSDCGSSDSGINGKCVCGKNRNANQYCELFFGDEPYLNYFQIIRDWHQSDYIGKCNTARRFSSVCAGDWWNRKMSYYMNYYYYFSKQYPSVVEYDNCVGQVFLQDFMQVKSMLNDIQLDLISFSEFILPLILWVFM